MDHLITKSSDSTFECVVDLMVCSCGWSSGRYNTIWTSTRRVLREEVYAHLENVGVIEKDK